jgi:hypothetical protein
MLASVAVFALSLGRPAVPLARPATARFAAPLCRASTAQSVFEISVDLGEGGGVVQGELTAFFTNSKLVTVRYPVPLVLQASPAKGVVRVEKDGMGLLAGDVLRACSTLEMRYNSQARLFVAGAAASPAAPQTAINHPSFPPATRTPHSHPAHALSPAPTP